MLRASVKSRIVCERKRSPLHSYARVSIVLISGSSKRFTVKTKSSCETCLIDFSGNLVLFTFSFYAIVCIPSHRTAASSTAVLVQLTPLLGALVGVVVTLALVAICLVIFMKFRGKHRHRNSNGGDTSTTEADKGSAEPLSRNLGSHSSLEDKNPDVIPQDANSEDDEFHLEEKAFDRLNLESQRILYNTPPMRLNNSSPVTVGVAGTPTSTPPPSLPPPILASPTFCKQVRSKEWPKALANTRKGCSFSDRFMSISHFSCVL